MKKFGKTLNAEQVATLERYKDKMYELSKKESEVFREYCDMEGKYGTKASSWYDCGQGFRGYHYEYASDELQRKEDAEREAFYNAHYLPIREEMNALNREYYDIFIPALCKELTGMTIDEFDMMQEKKSLLKRIHKLEKELAELQKEYTDKYGEE